MLEENDTEMLKSKVTGCLLGGFIGDCLGAPFEGDPFTYGGKLIVQRYFQKLDQHAEPVVGRSMYRQYTDDTVLTKCVAKCLTDKPPVDVNFLARLFVKAYFKRPNRGYGEGVVDVFKKLQISKFDDIYKPAREQFGGMGSFGNGGAMRIAPVGLYFYNNFNGMIDAARRVTEITHTHELGINGAILQCMAIQQCVNLDCDKAVDSEKFISDLIDKMKQFETDSEDSEEQITHPYQQKLEQVKKLLKLEPSKELDELVITTLGNDVSALHSVPTAIFCFLKANAERDKIEVQNVFRQTLENAISLGGDTDTIASMAGSLTGALLGKEHVSRNLLRHCEYPDDIEKIAANLVSAIE